MPRVPMTDARAGRVNALAFAILDANGDPERLAEQVRFFSDLTEADVDRALALVHWVKTAGARQFVQQAVKPFGLASVCEGAFG